MSVKLFFEAIIKYFLGVVLIGLLIFLPAGTIHYINGWVFMGVLFIPMFIAGIIMMIKNPKLLASRLEAKEKQKEQSVVVKISGLMGDKSNERLNSHFSLKVEDKSKFLPLCFKGVSIHYFLHSQF